MEEGTHGPVWGRIKEHLDDLYECDDATFLVQALQNILATTSFPEAKNQAPWSEKDVFLIMYGNSVKCDDEPPLLTLRRFLHERLEGTVSGVHILPFFPYSSDDGFSVINYRQVNPELGDWGDIEAIGKDLDLAVDLVINHVSRQGLWFADYLNDQEPGNRFFIEADPDADLSGVVRPRPGSVLVPVQTRRGLRHLWATFSADQIDVNFKRPEVLLEYLKILLHYVKSGARMIRLDAVAFLWKELGTSCIHLPQTHRVVKLIRDLLSLARPDCLIITETNVPHAENVSYFGDGDEAHLVYQFALPPLLLHALFRGTATYLNRWLMALSPPPSGCNFLNFTASHDGIGLRPVEGILPQTEVDELVQGMHRFGGYVSMRAGNDGTERPYELNIALFSAMKGSWKGEDALQVERFLCCETLMLSLQGIPAFYFHSLVATGNDTSGVERTGRTRSINRHRWDVAQLEELLDRPTSSNSRVFRELCRRAKIRRELKAFHPDSQQTVFHLSDAIVAFCRGQEKDRVICMFNLTDQPVWVEGRPLLSLEIGPGVVDLLEGQQPVFHDGKLMLEPYQALWLMD